MDCIFYAAGRAEAVVAAKGYKLSVPQEGHPYMALPKDGSPQ